MSLIELMVALFVVSLAFAGVYGMSTQVSTILSQARGETRATETAQHEIERLRGMSWAEISSLGSNYRITTGNNPAIADVPQGVGTVEISPYPATNAASTINLITVTIQWQNAAGTTATNQLTTLISSQGQNP